MYQVTVITSLAREQHKQKNDPYKDTSNNSIDLNL